jgi:hypothetical protein
MEPGITPETPQFVELVSAAAPVQWRKKKASEIRKFPIFDQDGSGSCVAQTLKKLLGIYIWLKTGVFLALSASHIYLRRSNAPSSGMIGINSFEIGQEGTTLAQFAPDEKMTDKQMDAVIINEFMLEVAKAFKSGKPIVVATGDIDTIASIIEKTKKGVMVWFYFTSKEWTERPKVLGTPNLNADSTLRHSVAAVDYTLTDDGKKALVIDDSWGPSAGNGAGQRIIDEDFFKTRNWFACYFMNFAYEENAPTPPVQQYKFLQDLEFIPLDAKGNISDPAKNAKQVPDVIVLQNRLKADGVFPSNVESTGYFGAITKDAVGKYQLKYKIVASATSAGYGRVGPLTREHLNNVGF